MHVAASPCDSQVILCVHADVQVAASPCDIQVMPRVCRELNRVLYVMLPHHSAWTSYLLRRWAVAYESLVHRTLIASNCTFSLLYTMHELTAVHDWTLSESRRFYPWNLEVSLIGNNFPSSALTPCHFLRLTFFFSCNSLSSFL